MRSFETTRPRSLSKISRSCFGLRPPRSSGPTQRWPSSISKEPKSRMYINISPVVQSARSYGERLAFLHDDRLRHSLPRVSAKKGQHSTPSWRVRLSRVYEFVVGNQATYSCSQNES